MDELDIQLRLNGRSTRVTVRANEMLAETLRRRLALTGTKVSCDAQVCGTCTVLVDGLAMSSCTLLAADVEARTVRTVEGLANARSGALDRLQRAFIEHGAFQCGYCTPGFLMMATALLDEVPSPTREEVVDYLEGSICRCTGYQTIVEAVLAAARDEVES